MGELDRLVAQRLARLQQLRHIDLECEPAQFKDIDAWLVNRGYSVRGRALQLATTSKRVSRLATFSLTRLGGDSGRPVD